MATLQFVLPTNTMVNPRNFRPAAVRREAKPQQSLLLNRVAPAVVYHNNAIVTSLSPARSRGFSTRRRKIVAMGSEDKFELIIELKSSPEKLWKQGIRQFVPVFSKAIPELYESIEVVEGDGRSVGTVFLATFKPEMKIAKERIEFVDEEGRRMSYSVVGGDFLVGYKSFVATVCVEDSANTDIGSVVKYSAQFQMAKEQLPQVSQQSLQAIILKVYHDLDAYLLHTP